MGRTNTVQEDLLQEDHSHEGQTQGERVLALPPGSGTMLAHLLDAGAPPFLARRAQIPTTSSQHWPLCMRIKRDHKVKDRTGDLIQPQQMVIPRE